MNDKQTIQLMLDALEYHTEQTRPIQKTTEAIVAGNVALAQAEPASPANILKVQALMRLMVRKFRNACSTTDYDQVYKELQRAAHEVLAQPNMRKTTREEKIVRPGVYEVPEQVKPWVGLTDDERDHLTYGIFYYLDIPDSFMDAFEAKLKEKNT